MQFGMEENLKSDLWDVFGWIYLLVASLWRPEHVSITLLLLVNWASLLLFSASCSLLHSHCMDLQVCALEATVCSMYYTGTQVLIGCHLVSSQADTHACICDHRRPRAPSYVTSLLFQSLEVLCLGPPGPPAWEFWSLHPLFLIPSGQLH